MVGLLVLQVHTTGMDIKQGLNASAFVTLNKDTTLRDFAQGCWRMRGLARGQTVRLLYRAEVGGLVARTYPELRLDHGNRAGYQGGGPPSGAALPHVVGWLVVNAMRLASMQSMALCVQVCQAARDT